MLICGTVFSLSAALAKAEAASHDVALTFDDLPHVTRDTLSPSEGRDAAVKANDAILAVLRRAGMAATAFVNESKVEALGSVGPQILSQWNQGPLQLANHGYHHFDSNKLSLHEIETEIMLLHSNALNAAVLPAVIAIFKADHTRFISLADAQSDPAYAHEPKTATAYGPMWGYRWANERHIPVDGSLEKEAPQWVVSYCDQSGRAR